MVGGFLVIPSILQYVMCIFYLGITYNTLIHMKSFITAVPIRRFCQTDERNSGIYTMPLTEYNNTRILVY